MFSIFELNDASFFAFIGDFIENTVLYNRLACSFQSNFTFHTTYVETAL